MLRLTTLAVLVAAMAPLTPAAHAQDYPTKTVRLVVPFPPGNASDVIARALSDRLQKRLGQPVVVENRVGGSGIVAIQTVLGAEPDGHTLLVSSLSPVVLNPALHKKLPYDSLRDLAPVALIGYTSMMLIANRDLPAKTLKEAVELISKNPGKYSSSHIGPGSLSQLSFEAFKKALGLDVVPVAYRGSNQAITDIISGNIAFMMDSLTSANPQAQGGNVRPLAVTTPVRSKFAPDVPTMQEAGLPLLAQYDISAWTGMLAPAKTPPAVIERLNREVNELLKDPEVRGLLEAQFQEPYPPKTTAEFTKFLQEELVKWERIATEAGVKGSL